jgi:hypothetical protein
MIARINPMAIYRRSRRIRFANPLASTISKYGAKINVPRCMNMGLNNEIAATILTGKTARKKFNDRRLPGHRLFLAKIVRSPLNRSQ